MVTLLQFILSKEMRKEAKPQGENPPSIKDMKSSTKNVELLVLLLLQTKCWCLEEYSSWEEDKSTHLDQGQLQDGNWDHVEQLKSNDVKEILKDIETCNQLEDDDMTWTLN